MTMLHRSLIVAALVASAAATIQAQTPPPAPVRDTARVRLRPPATEPPSRAAATAPAAVQLQTAPVRQPSRPGVAPDSVAPRATAAQEMPANAVARCGDGTYLVDRVDAAGCATHGGLSVILPRSAAPQRPAATARPAAVPTAAVAQPQTPPAGATMRCKDGTYLAGTPSAERCGSNGGLAAILPAGRPASPPAAPARPRQ
jgi:hypothetical protein